jgi:D-beta-D-heptose 7-phosphate kinase / D-beta-D-heptose 1-phosphate adenosyltransferase
MGALDDVRGLSDWLPDRLAALDLQVTVIGDVMLDGWWTGLIERFCREAPVPVVDLTGRDYAPGGAANTAMNLAALGARVRLGGVAGDDDAGRRLRGLLEAGGVDVSAVPASADTVTTTKNRVVGGDQILLRIDEQPATVPGPVLARLAQLVPELVAGADAVVVCDYGSGALGGPVREALHRCLSRQPGRPLVVVDAHDARSWAGLRPDLVTPNAQEAAQLLGTRLEAGSDRAAAVAARRDDLLQASGAAAAVVTLDRDGTVLLSGRPEGSHRTWARAAAEKQASGAGDTFVAALTLARAAGLPLTTCLDLAQAAADVVVHRAGTSVCSAADLAGYLRGFADTALPADELVRRIAHERAAGRRIVLTNGCFDVLHRGHTLYLNQAKQLGDVLVVALNGDESVRRLKGPDRPINPIADRAAVIAALSCVDYVTVFDTDTPIPLINALQPDVYAKGGDYSPQMLAETGAVQAYGGTVSILDYVAERSTSAMVRRIRGAEPSSAQSSAVEGTG